MHKLETLPESLVKEVEDFIDFLKTKHGKKTGRSRPREKSRGLYGAAEGLFIIPKDFNEPLDDLKDYM